MHRTSINIPTEEYPQLKEIAKKNNKSLTRYTIHAVTKCNALEDFLLRFLQDNNQHTQSILRNEGLKLLKM